jgi:hypothetical protein
MKTILRRVGSLENKLAPKASLAALHLDAVREDQRRRQLEAKANGQPSDDSPRDDKPTAPNGWLAIAEGLRLYQNSGTHK